MDTVFEEGGLCALGVRYFNDVWEFDVEELTWAEVGPASGAMPGPRGGCRIAVYGDSLLVYGGHSVAVDRKDKSETETCYDDTWAMDLATHQVTTVWHPGLPRTTSLKRKFRAFVLPYLGVAPHCLWRKYAHGRFFGSTVILGLCPMNNQKLHD